MADREKVIKGIDICLQRFHCGEGCPYYNDAKIGCMEQLREDALDLLKEREAVEPTLIREGRNKHYNDYVCPRCDNEVVYEQNYCTECGVQFLWEGR